MAPSREIGMRADVLVIGAGHNGLTAAAWLAAAGRRVTVLERRAVPGGVCATREFHPGYRVPGLLHDASGFRPWIAKKLRLDRHGLRWEAPQPVLVHGERGGFLLPSAAGERLRSAPDQAAYADWRRFLDRVAGVVRRLADHPPPAFTVDSPGALLELALTGLGLERLGRRRLTELLRVGPMSVADWLDELFLSDPLKEALAARALAGSFAGPRSPGTAVNLLLRECTRGRAVEGGPAALVASLVAACRRRGVELRLESSVARIRLRDGRAEGVVLESGEEIAAAAVIGACDPRQTLLDLLPLGALPLRLEEALRRYRSRGLEARVHLALSAPADLRDPTGALCANLRIGGGRLDALELAFDRAKHGGLPEAPWLDVHVPTHATPALAPPGHQVVSIRIHGTPRELDAGWTTSRREALGKLATEILGRVMPDLPAKIVAAEVLTPADLEDLFDLPGGHLYHGELALDQLFSMRPVAGLARYATPVAGLFLASDGCHPGGGVTGIPGALAARAVLSASRTRRRP